MNRKSKFSARHGLGATDREITIRHDAPPELRAGVVQIGVDTAKLGPSGLREIVCSALRKLPDRSNWSDYPNIWNEVQQLVEEAPWYKIYDIIEGIHTYLRERSPYFAGPFQDEINNLFRELGIGWKLVNGAIEARGPDAIEEIVTRAKEALSAAKLPTAGGELQEAIRDVARRPTPDTTGALQHAMAALECVARVATGDTKATLGEIVKHNPGLLPPPMDGAVEKMWGYASQVARHVQEGTAPGWDDAQAAVGLAAVVVTYLSAKLKMK